MVTITFRRLAAALSFACAFIWAMAPAAGATSANGGRCRQGDRGRLIGYELVASYLTADEARAHFEEWRVFYQDFFDFPENLPVTFEYGFDSYKVTYCTDDAVLPGQ